MTCIEVFAASCAALCDRPRDLGRFRPFQFFRTEVRRIGRPHRDDAYREDMEARRVFENGGAADPGVFFQALFETAERSAGGDEPVILLHIHGFASTPQTATARGGELGDKYEVSAQGRKPTVLSFIWPSEGCTVDVSRLGGGLMETYRRERRVATLAGGELAAFLFALSKARRAWPRRMRVILLAHSMGNLVLQNAIPMIARAGLAALHPEPFFDLVFLMAGDCDFQALDPGRELAALDQLSPCTQVFFAPTRDEAVRFAPHASAKGDAAQRLGHQGPSKDARRSWSSLGWYDCDDVAITVKNDFNHQYCRLSREAIEEAKNALRHAAVGAAGRQPELFGAHAPRRRFRDFFHDDRFGEG